MIESGEVYVLKEDVHGYNAGTAVRCLYLPMQGTEALVTAINGKEFTVETGQLQSPSEWAKVFALSTVFIGVPLQNPSQTFQEATTNPSAEELAKLGLVLWEPFQELCPINVSKVLHEIMSSVYSLIPS